MANEKMYPLLPCRDLDESIAFYKALGFRQTYRQLRPNPSAVVELEEIQIHLFGMPDFVPENSYGSVIIAVPDPDSLYRAFAGGLRTAYGKLPSAGIPRILRPRKKFGTVRGFSVVDPGGNWLRIFRLGDTEERAAEEKVEGLDGIVRVAARLGDAHGDEAAALKTLENGLERFRDASALAFARAYLYRAELAVRLKDLERARASLSALSELELSKEERASLEDETAHVELLISQEGLP